RQYLAANGYAATYLDAWFVDAISARRFGWMPDSLGSARWTRCHNRFNRLASIVKFASVLTTNSRNGANISANAELAARIVIWAVRERNIILDPSLGAAADYARPRIRASRPAQCIRTSAASWIISSMLA